MQLQQAGALLNDLFLAAGGEFKKENKGGYFYGAGFLFLGLAAAFYIGYVLLFGGVLIRPILVIITAVACLTAGFTLIRKSALGKYRDDDDPFKA